MQMVGVGLVIIRRQGCRKQRAAAVPHLFQKARPLVIRVPVTGDRDGAPVGEPEGNDIDRVGGGMFAVISGLRMADPSAAVAAIGQYGIM